MPPPHYHGHRKRLRERFVKNGLAGFAEHEALELLLTLAIPRTDVKQPAKALLKRFGSLRGVLDAPLAELRCVPGIGEVAAIGLHLVREAAALYLQQESEGGDVLRNPTKISDFWRMRIGALKHEVFAVAYLDSASSSASTTSRPPAPPSSSLACWCIRPSRTSTASPSTASSTP